MPEINLLNNNSGPKAGIGSTLASTMSKALIVVLVLLLAYWGYALFATRSARNSIASAKYAIEQDQQDIIKNGGRNEVLTRQAQLKQADTLITNHVYWSRFFSDIAKATLKTAAYGGFAVDADGVITASVIVPDYQSLDQFLQVFDLPAYNGNFSNVKIVSVSKSQDENVEALDARIKFNYSVGALKNKQSPQ